MTKKGKYSAPPSFTVAWWRKELAIVSKILTKSLPSGTMNKENKNGGVSFYSIDKIDTDGSFSFHFLSKNDPDNRNELKVTLEKLTIKKEVPVEVCFRPNSNFSTFFSIEFKYLKQKRFARAVVPFIKYGDTRLLDSLAMREYVFK